uniref:Uncharacterized protein n=1 Tax=Rhizophora mucronata TaxID=61149 RepID=A0A2P2NVI6_RHIMU
MSSFFPSPSDQWPRETAASPSPLIEPVTSVPSSGEFVGTTSSSSGKFNGQITVLGGLCTFFAMRLLVSFA